MSSDTSEKIKKCVHQSNCLLFCDKICLCFCENVSFGKVVIMKPVSLNKKSSDIGLVAGTTEYKLYNM